MIAAKTESSNGLEKVRAVNLRILNAVCLAIVHDSHHFTILFFMYILHSPK